MICYNDPMPIRVKRIYESPSPDDGLRVLVDRLWPRGVSKESAHLDLWLKEITPSPQLRKWFGHRAERWDIFEDRYIRELDAKDDAVFEPVVEPAASSPVTLLYAAKAPHYNHVNILKVYLERRFGPDA